MFEFFCFLQRSNSQNTELSGFGGFFQAKKSKLQSASRADSCCWSRMRSMGRVWMIPPFGEQHPCPFLAGIALDTAGTDTLRIPWGIFLPISSTSVKFGQCGICSGVKARPQHLPDNSTARRAFPKIHGKLLPDSTARIQGHGKHVDGVIPFFSPHLWMQGV